MKKMIFAAVSILLAAAILTTCKQTSPGNAVDVYPRAAAPLEEFAARELQRYFYLRTGILADLVRGDSAPSGYDHRFILGNKDRNLGADGFLIKSYTKPRGRQHVIAGGGGRGTLYGAYRLLGTVDNARWTDENTPKDWAMSSINTRYARPAG